MTKKMKTSKCRIGKIKFKSGGEMQLIRTEPRSYCSVAVQNMSKCIDERTVVVGFFTISENRTVRTGLSYEAGITNCDLLGGVEALKSDILQREILDDG